MNQITISKEDLLKLLDKCFEEGYSGYLDLKEDCINSMLEGYLSSKNLVYSCAYNPNIYQLQLPGIDNIGGQYDVSRNSLFRSNEVVTTTSTNPHNSGQITLSFNY